MASAVIQVSLPESLSPFVEAQVEAGAYDSPADYIRELIVNDRNRSLARLEDRLLQTLESKPIEISEEEWESEDLLDILRSKLPVTR